MNSICLIVSSLEILRRLIQTKVYYKYFYSVSKETTHKPSSSSCEKIFLQCAYHRYNLLRWMFFILFDNWKSLFSVNVRRYFEILLAAITACKVSKYGVFSGPYFLAFGLNTERYFVSLCIQSECGKIRTKKTSVFGHFSHSENHVPIWANLRTL